MQMSWMDFLLFNVTVIVYYKNATLFSCNSVRMFHDGDVTVARGEAECNSDSPKWNISDLLLENQCSILFVIW